MRDCSTELRLAGKPYPRTCAICGLGPCITQKELDAKKQKFDNELKLLSFPKVEMVDETSLQSARKHADNFHAKQQLAEFTKAAMQGLCSMDVALQDNELFIAETACKIARATIDEMIRREKEDEAGKA